MANNFLVKDGNDVSRVFKSTEVGGVHTPTVKAEGPLSDAELRAAPVPVSHSGLTDGQLRASPVSVSGPATNAELRASPLPVSGPATNAELRASPLPVTGPLTSGQLAVLKVQVVDAPEANWLSGTFTVAEDEQVDIAIPDGAEGVKIYPRHEDTRYALDDIPKLPAGLDQLSVGGIAKPGIWTNIRFRGDEVTFRLRSTETIGSGSPPDPALVDVVFYGEFLGSSS